MNTPFKMKPGRGNMPKTGRDIPPTLMYASPMNQTDPKSGMTKEKAKEKIEGVFSENARRVAAEAVAKSDSVNVAKSAMILGKSPKMAGREGNKAANIARAKANIPNVVQGHYTSGNKEDAYWRAGQLEADVPKNVVKAYRNNK
jgi:hypothetical protein